MLAPQVASKRPCRWPLRSLTWNTCVSPTLWSRLPLPQRKAGNGQLDVREKKMVDNDEVWV